MGYEYKEIVADSSMVSLLLDGYENFGWKMNDSLSDDSMGVKPGGGKTMIRLKLFLGVVGAAFMDGSTFAATAQPPQYILCILLAIPGVLGWIFPYFLYKKIVGKQTKKVTPLIEAKYDEIYEICEKGNKLILDEVQYMIRKATFDDVELIEDTYNEHFKHEEEQGAFTIFKKGIYPTRKDAEKAVNLGALYVYEEDNNIAGSVIVDRISPVEYTEIVWGQAFADDEVMVIHLLMVRPGMAGKGIATSLVRFALKLAENNSCKALRLDTGSQNIPAISLYKKLGFQIVATAPMKVGNAIEHREHLFLQKVL